MLWPPGAYLTVILRCKRLIVGRYLGWMVGGGIPKLLMDSLMKFKTWCMEGIYFVLCDTVLGHQQVTNGGRAHSVYDFLSSAGFLGDFFKILQKVKKKSLEYHFFHRQITSWGTS